MAKTQPKTDEQNKLDAELKKQQAAEKKAADEAKAAADADHKAPESSESEAKQDSTQKTPAADKKVNPAKNEPKVKVFSQVHMTCLDGTKLVIGEFAHLSQSEYERLKKDARGPFFKE